MQADEMDTPEDVTRESLKLKIQWDNLQKRKRESDESTKSNEAGQNGDLVEKEEQQQGRRIGIR